MSAKENYRQILYQQPVGNCKIITHSCGLFTSSFQDTPKVNIAKNIVNTAGCFLISCQNPSSLKSVGASRPPADVFAFILGEENAPRQRSGRANRLFFQGKGYVLFGTIASGEGFGEKNGGNVLSAWAYFTSRWEGAGRKTNKYFKINWLK